MFYGCCIREKKKFGQNYPRTKKSISKKAETRRIILAWALHSRSFKQISFETKRISNLIRLRHYVAPTHPQPFFKIIYMQHLWRLFNRFSLSYLWLPERSQLNIHYTICCMLPFMNRIFFYKKSFWVWPNIFDAKIPVILVCIHRKCLLIHFSKLLDLVWMLRKVFIFLNFLMRKLFKCSLNYGTAFACYEISLCMLCPENSN